MESTIAVSGRPWGRRTVWQAAAWSVALAAVIGLAAAESRVGWLSGGTEGGAARPYSAVVLVLLALGCEFVDASVGMGYGTTLTPVLVLMGYPVGAVVPATIASQLAANVAAAFFHHRIGNVDFLRDRRSRRTALILGATGLAVPVFAVMIAVRLPAKVTTTAVAVMVFSVGWLILAGSRLRLAFRWRNISILAAAAAFAKAFSGGGYGPLVCGGQLLAGLPARKAVATTALAEAIVCASAVVSYLLAGAAVPAYLLVPLAAGAVLSTPLSALAVRRLPSPLLRKLIGVAVAALGSVSLVKVIWGGL